MTTREEFYREARTDLAGPLDGVRVLDVTTAWAGPMAGCILADIGCDVVRVEMPGNREGQMPPEIPGTGLSWFRETLNRNKRSVSLDLRLPGGRDVFLQLVATADVVVENFRPGTLAGWGVGFEQCRAVKPDIVFVSLSGWGQFGPAADRPGYDPIAQAVSGWMALNGDAQGAPTKAATFLADDLAALHATIGTLAALHHRDRTGEGQHVDVSLLDALLFQSNGFLTLGATGVPLERRGNEIESLVPCNTFECRDGSVYITIALDRHWRRLAEAMGRPEFARAPGFATNAERCANRETVNAAVADWCSAHSTGEVVDTLEQVGVTAARVGTFQEAARDPHVVAREMLQETVLSNGTVAPLTGPAVKFSRTPTRVRHGAPAPDTGEVLAELGIDEQTAPGLRASSAR